MVKVLALSLLAGGEKDVNSIGFGGIPGLKIETEGTQLCFFLVEHRPRPIHDGSNGIPWFYVFSKSASLRDKQASKSAACFF